MCTKPSCRVILLVILFLGHWGKTGSCKMGVVKEALSLMIRFVLLTKIRTFKFFSYYVNANLLIKLAEASVMVAQCGMKHGFVLTNTYHLNKRAYLTC